MALLEVRQLIKSYSGRRVVDRVSLTVDAGEIVGLLGRNGAGKTTTFRMTIGMITPEAGRVIFKDEDMCSQEDNRGGFVIPSRRNSLPKKRLRPYETHKAGGKVDAIRSNRPMRVCSICVGVLTDAS